MGITCNVTATSRAARSGFRAHFTFFGGGALGIGRDFLSFAISLVCGDGNPCPSAMALMMSEKLPFSGLCVFFGRVMLLAMYFICPFACDNAILKLWMSNLPHHRLMPKQRHPLPRLSLSSLDPPLSSSLPSRYLINLAPPQEAIVSPSFLKSGNIFLIRMVAS